LQVGFQREDFVEGGFLAGAAELQRAEHGVLFAAGDERDEGIGHLDAPEIEHVGAAFGIGVEEDGGLGHSQRRLSRRTGRLALAG
jgi:hypothetical protein